MSLPHGRKPFSLLVGVDSFRLLSSLRLSVRWNNIRTEGLLALAQAVKVNSGLTHINIWGNHLEEPVCQVSSSLLSTATLLVTIVFISVSSSGLPGADLQRASPAGADRRDGL